MTLKWAHLERPYKTSQENLVLNRELKIEWDLSFQVKKVIFDFSGKLIQRFGSRANMHVVLLVFAIRFLYYSTIVSPWQILGVEMLNGLTTGKFKDAPG